MKQIFVTVALLAAVVLAAADTALFKYAPNDSTGAVEVDVLPLLKHPRVAEALNKPEYVKTRQEWESKTGIRLQDFKKVVFFVNASGKGIVLLNVDKNLDLEKFFSQNQVKFQKLTVAGKTILRVMDPVKNNKTAELAVLAPGVIIAGEKGDIARYLNAPRGNARALQALVQKIPAGFSMWTAFVNTFPNPQGQVEDPRQLYFAFRFAGKEQRDLNFSLKLFCNDANGAQALSAMLPMYANMGLAMVFSSDLKLGNELVMLLKPVVEENTVLADVTISAELVEKIAVYFEKNAKKFVKKQKAAAKKRVPAKKSGTQAAGTEKR